MQAWFKLLIIRTPNLHRSKTRPMQTYAENSPMRKIKGDQKKQTPPDPLLRDRTIYFRMIGSNDSLTRPGRWG